MKKTVWIRFFKALLLVVPIVFFIFFMQNHLMYFDDYNTFRLNDFYKEPPHSLDVVFIGASDVFAAFSPVHAYAQAGITSFPYCSDGLPSSLYLPALKEVLSRQSPQLIIVEIQGFLKSDSFSETSLRRLVENIPFSRNKLETILRDPFEDKLSCLVPFFKYHGDWQLTTEEISEYFSDRARKRQPSPSRLKGCVTQSAMNTKSTLYPDADDDTRLELHPDAHEHLLEFLDYCTVHGLDNVVFTRFPQTIDTDFDYRRFVRANEAGCIIEDHGFQFLHLNRLTEDISLDATFDQYNSDHLNISGQLKLTEYLTYWITDEYGLLPMEQTEENAQFWEDCIPYAEACAEIAMEYWENGLPKWFYEKPSTFELLDERIASWYAGGL